MDRLGQKLGGGEVLEREQPTEKVRAGSDQQLWCGSAHLRQPDRRNHPHCQSRSQFSVGGMREIKGGVHVLVLAVFLTEQEVWALPEKGFWDRL